MAPHNPLYKGYVAFKGWAETPDTDTPTDYAALFALSGKPTPCRLLDIGFGKGDLLDWAKSHGFETHGLEIIPELVERARLRGHNVVEGELSKLSATGFDVITAIDVLEHLTVPQLSQLLKEARRLLAPDGVFIARFPNGQSPFFGAYQHGDLTHELQLTPNALRQLADDAGLTLMSATNFRPGALGVSGLKRRAAYLLRDFVEVALGYAYFGQRIPMDPNIVVVLRIAR